MTNADAHSNPLPGCENCDFFNAEHGQCTRHQFMMPQIDWQILCRDWQHAGEGMNAPTHKEGMLYYYSPSAGMQGELRPFHRLRRLWFSVSLRPDDEYGWIVFPRRYFEYFPEPTTAITLRLSKQPYPFRVVKTERSIATELIPIRGGNWESQQRTQQFVMLVSMGSVTLLQDWLATYLDIGRIQQDTIAPSIFAFIEVLKAGTDYALHPDILTYHKYLRV